MALGKNQRIPGRILVAKLGLDGHDRGVKIIAHTLRDAGYEVIYTGLFQSPQTVARAAVQEDAQIVAISALSGTHMVLFPKVVRILKNLGARHIKVIGGGIISSKEAKILQRKGLTRVFGPGTDMEQILSFITQELGNAKL